MAAVSDKAATAAPWRVETGPTKCGGPRTVAEIIDGRTLREIRIVHDGDSEGDSEADAELIAAAANAYEAHQRAAEALRLYVEHFGDPLKVARAALAELDRVTK